MQVYGDHESEVDSAAMAAAIIASADALRAERAGLAWHSRCVTLLIDLGALLQGIADHEAGQSGVDQPSPVQQALLARLVDVAASARASWCSGFVDQTCPELGGLAALGLSAKVTVRRPEGYAFYALYPEAYLAAAAAVPRGAVVIGLRSIGTALAAVVAEASEAAAVFTVRPRGPAFARTIAAGPRLEQAIAARANSAFVIVDEGPGLSGSSFGGTADWLERLGVSRQRIGFMPSHGGTPGPAADTRHRMRWSTAARWPADFDMVIAGPAAGYSLAQWFTDITGPPTRPLRELSGGAWATDTGLPTDPGREARKFVLPAEKGCFRLKFVGLDHAGQAKLARAEALHRGGFGVRPLALRHGFLLEPELAARSAGQVPVERLGDYLAFRDRNFPAEQGGAPLARLAAAAAANIAEACSRLDLRAVTAWCADQARALQGQCRPVHVDARMHRWEWLMVEGQPIKCDALDHAQAHDLVGCQDIAWDVAGAIVEHQLPADQARWLAARVLGGNVARLALLPLMTFCYLGFQLGWWSFSTAPAGQARSRWYADRAAAFVSGFDPVA